MRPTHGRLVFRFAPATKWGDRPRRAGSRRRETSQLSTSADCKRREQSSEVGGAESRAKGRQWSARPLFQPSIRPQDGSGGGRAQGRTRANFCGPGKGERNAAAARAHCHCGGLSGQCARQKSRALADSEERRRRNRPGTAERAWRKRREPGTPHPAGPSENAVERGTVAGHPARYCCCVGRHNKRGAHTTWATAEHASRHCEGRGGSRARGTPGDPRRRRKTWPSGRRGRAGVHLPGVKHDGEAGHWRGHHIRESAARTA